MTKFMTLLSSAKSKTKQLNTQHKKSVKLRNNILQKNLSYYKYDVLIKKLTDSIDKEWEYEKALNLLYRKMRSEKRRMQ